MSVIRKKISKKSSNGITVEVINMKNIEEEHCPYCKRHCLLSNPRCGKGKALVRKKGKEEKQEVFSSANVIYSNAMKEIKENQAVWVNIQDNVKLITLFHECNQLIYEKQGKGLKKENEKVSILTQLEKHGEMSVKELEANVNLSLSDLNKRLHKLEKKGYVNLLQDEESNVKVTLRENAIMRWKSHEKKKAYDSFVFSKLEKEEKEYLEKILRKICER